jgi:beta-glucosidase
MGFVEGGARCYMASYNAWNGVPLTIHPLLKELTVKEWGVDGIICTDAGSLGNLVRQHKAYPDLAPAAAASNQGRHQHVPDDLRGLQGRGEDGARREPAHRGRD